MYWFSNHNGHQCAIFSQSAVSRLTKVSVQYADNLKHRSFSFFSFCFLHVIFLGAILIAQVSVMNYSVDNVLSQCRQFAQAFLCLQCGLCSTTVYEEVGKC